MKKFLPLILLLVGTVALIVAFFAVRGKKGEQPETPEEETQLLEVPLNERPVVSLTPTIDGHYLNLDVSKILIKDAQTMDYELLYQNNQGITQGVPGTVKLETLKTTSDGKKAFSAELLLGSESSGKFRYDEGVEKGLLTLRFRNSEGKLLVKFSTDFVLKKDLNVLESPDGIFKIELEEPVEGYIVLMNSIGLPDAPPKELSSGPYGIFTSLDESLRGRFEMGEDVVYYHVTGPRWSSLEETAGAVDSETNIFVGLKR